MKKGMFIFGLVFIFACNNNNSAGKPTDLTDSLGSKTTDTTSHGDTASYERMQTKTNYGDTSSGEVSSHHKDTAYYERLPNKKNPRDSSH